MTVTRAQLIARAARRLGAAVGTITSGTASSAVLGGLINTTGDESAYRGWRLLMPDASAEADKEKFIDIWDDATGTARFIARVTDTSLAGETYIVSPREDYTLREYRDALNVALRETTRTYRYAIPLTPSQRVIPLTPLTWMVGGGSLSAAWVSDNPNLVHNGEFGLWHDGAAAAPDGWTASGSGATIARVAGTHSPYAVSVTRAKNDVTLTQSIPAALREYLTRSDNAPLTTLRAYAWTDSSTASIARVGISNGTTTTWSSYHTGTGVAQGLATSYTPTATDLDLALVLSVDTSDGEATFNFAGLVADTAAFPVALRDEGDSAYSELEVAYVMRNLGGQPAVELLQRAPSAQLVTYTRRSFAELDSDLDAVDDQYARALEAGMLAKLLQARKPNQDRTRLDVIMAEEQRIWNRLTANFNSLPVPKPPARYEIVGA